MRGATAAALGAGRTAFSKLLPPSLERRTSTSPSPAATAMATSRSFAAAAVKRTGSLPLNSKGPAKRRSISQLPAEKRARESQAWPDALSEPFPAPVISDSCQTTKMPPSIWMAVG